MFVILLCSCSFGLRTWGTLVWDRCSDVLDVLVCFMFVLVDVRFWWVVTLRWCCVVDIVGCLCCAWSCYSVDAILLGSRCLLNECPHLVHVRIRLMFFMVDAIVVSLMSLLGWCSCFSGFLVWLMSYFYPHALLIYLSTRPRSYYCFQGFLAGSLYQYLFTLNWPEILRLPVHSKRLKHHGTDI